MNGAKAWHAQQKKASVKYTKEYEKFVTKRDETLRVTLDGGDIPPGVTGLIPDGNTKVSWRWMGEVFEESTHTRYCTSIYGVISPWPALSPTSSSTATRCE